MGELEQIAETVTRIDERLANHLEHQAERWKHQDGHNERFYELHREHDRRQWMVAGAAASVPTIIAIVTLLLALGGCG